nr:hypothetical protein [uncultured Bacillus sp.]
MAFNKPLFLKLLGEETFIKKVKWYDEIESSQDVIKLEILETNEFPTLIGAEDMKNARGQYTREFIISKGNGLYFSIAIPKKNILNIIQHTKLIMAISIASAIKKGPS